MLASLNHPNIAAIDGVEERALVMELVEGPTLAEHIAAGAIALAEALPILHQIVDALEYAHEKGIIHRDLKPANIKVTPEGRVKVLDFGLAKALGGDVATGDPALSPTLTMRATSAGTIMGTAAYMSPEQARGHDVDRRADIWSFGVVVYEMVTGRQLFEAPTVSDTLAAVLTREPDFNAAPPKLRRLLRLCLVRDARQRLRDISGARLLLDETPAVTPAASRRTVYPWIAAAAAVVAVLALGALWRTTRPVDRPMMRFSADLGPDAIAGSRITAAISPDGTRIAFPVRGANGVRQLATRLLDQSKTTILSGTDNAVDPFFSPDGQWIGFFTDTKLKKISVRGGAAVTLCDASVPRGAAWGEDGIIATLDALHLSRVPAAGGTPQILTKPEDRGERTHRWPQILPGGQTLLFTASIGVGGYEDANIEALSLKTGQIKIAQRGGYFGRYLPSDHLIYLHQGTLFGVPFDASRLEIRGTPAPLLEDVAGASDTGGGQLDLSQNGTLVYLSGKSQGLTRPVWMDSTGKQTPLGAASGLTPRLSPDGKLLALSVNGDISVYDPRGALLRITFNPTATNRYPVWTPDGKHIVFASAGLWWVRADGSGQPQQIFESKANPFPGSFSPDGRRLAFAQVAGTTSRDIWILPLDLTDPDHPKSGKAEPFVSTPAFEADPAFSPDGRWLAYDSNESGTFHVFVRPFPVGDGKWQISTAPGRFPIWSRNGKELFFESTDGHIMVAEYTTRGETFAAGKPRQWSNTPIGGTGAFQNLDLAPDGKRFVVIPLAESEKGEGQTVHVTFLLNFFDELRRRMPPGDR